VEHTGSSNVDAFDVTLQNLIDSVANHLHYVSETLAGPGGRPSGLSKRMLLQSRLRQATPLGFAFDDFFSALAPTGRADLNGDGTIDNDDSILFQGRLGGVF